MSDRDQLVAALAASNGDNSVGSFTESYAVFQRSINRLQRQYIQLREEFSAQNSQLVALNRELVSLTGQNVATTQFLDSILRALGVAVVAVDRRGIITHCNPAACHLLGVEESALLGQPYEVAVPSLADDGATAAAAIRSGETVANVPRRLILPGQPELQLSVSTALLHDDEGAISGAVEICHDLTPLRRMEQEVARLNTLVALGEMAATIAHEVRNPLAGIAGFASLLRNDLEEEDPRRRTADKIIKGVEALDHTVTTLLNYTRQEELQMQSVSLLPWLTQIIARWRTESPDRGRPTLRAPKDPALVDFVLSVDPVLMHQVLFNLFANAYEAAGDGDVTITLSTRLLARSHAVVSYGDQIPLTLNETIVELLVSDDGPGVPSEMLPKLFRPFFTTKKQGTGLGLAAAAKIVRAHGGAIDARPAEPTGLTIVIALPVALPSATAPTRMSESGERRA